jgi:hypothetical protein
MPLDFEAVAHAARARQIALGQRFGSQDTLNQANQTLAAYDEYGTALAPYGFVTKDAQQLRDARDLLVEAGVGREVARGKNKITGQALTDSMTQGQNGRLRARSILENVLEELEEAGVEGAARTVGTALQQTAVAAEAAEGMAAQLELLAHTLTAEDIRAVAEERGGEDAVTALELATRGLRAADQDHTGGRGTPAETQRLDQIDGIIVRLSRRARKAAVAAGRALGNPALAHAFRLDQLYRTRASAPPDDAPGEDGGEDDDGPDEPENP